jgi:SAM-dependent methyltransferase
MIDVFAHNAAAWDLEAERGGNWSRPVSAQEIADARRGRWKIWLTPRSPVPGTWFPDLNGCDLLCLASAGGQQAPILAAAGANVTVYDASPEQLRRDREVAERDNLKIRTVQGNISNLGAFPSYSFDLIVHACSNCFVPDVQPVWAEAYRVLREGGSLLSGFLNPLYFMFDRAQDDRGVLEVKYRLPFSDLTSLDEDRRREKIRNVEPLEFGHTLTQLIGGQIAAGFHIAGFYEDWWTDAATNLNRFAPTYIATRAIRDAGA